MQNLMWGRKIIVTVPSSFSLCLIKDISEFCFLILPNKCHQDKAVLFLFKSVCGKQSRPVSHLFLWS